MANVLTLTFIGALAGLMTSCATAPVAIASKGPGSSADRTPLASASKPARLQKVRTTAYTHNEGSGSRNALGRRLATGAVKSAASDWSRYPLGTKFRVVSTGDEYIVDDYGGALIGTNSIDLYKPSKLEMRRWGVRHVEIEVLEWGSDAESLRVLRPRKGTRLARRMIEGIENKKG